MNVYKALGLLLLITGGLIFLFFYDPNNISGGIFARVLDMSIPILCIVAGAVIFIKGLFWKPPVTKKKSSSARGKKKKKH